MRYARICSEQKRAKPELFGPVSPANEGQNPAIDLKRFKTRKFAFPKTAGNELQATGSFDVQRL